MNPLTFHHHFSNGIDVTLSVRRDCLGIVRMESDKENFHSGVETEYLAWVDEVARTVHEVSSEEERAVDFMEGLMRVAGL